MTDAAISDAILEYLAEHPRAADTLDGIAEWWMARQQVRINVTALARVLADMTTRGLLEMTGPADAPRYRLAHRRLE